jgi:hypothetical protein
MAFELSDRANCNDTGFPGRKGDNIRMISPTFPISGTSMAIIRAASDEIRSDKMHQKEAYAMA